jgi:hypothetical protein
VARAQRLLHAAVAAGGIRRQDLDRQRGHAFDAQIRNDPRPVLRDEDDIVAGRPFVRFYANDPEKPFTRTSTFTSPPILEPAG